MSFISTLLRRDTAGRIHHMANPPAVSFNGGTPVARSTDSDRYLSAKNAAGSGVWAPYRAAHAPTTPVGDLDVRIHFSMDVYPPPGVTTMVARWEAAGKNSWHFGVQPDGKLLFQWSIDGTNFGGNAFATVNPPIVAGQEIWVRMTRQVATGTYQFFTSTDGKAWTKLGADVVFVSSVAQTTANIWMASRIGAVATTWNGKFFYGSVGYEIDGPPAIVFDAAAMSAGGRSYTSVSGDQWTVGSASAIINADLGILATTTATGGALRLTGAAGGRAYTPDAPANSTPGDLDLRIYLKPDWWIPSNGTDVMELFTKWLGLQLSWRFRLSGTGPFVFSWSADGTNVTGSMISINPALQVGTAKWVRFTFDVDNGAGGRTGTYYLSDDGVTWTQLGTPIVNAGVTSIFDSTADVTVGAVHGGASAGQVRGDIYYAEMRTVIDGPIVASFDARGMVPGQDTYTAPTGEVWVVAEPATQIVNGIGAILAGVNYVGEAVSITLANPIIAFNAGLPVDIAGSLCVVVEGAVRNIQAGIPYSSADRVVLTAAVPAVVIEPMLDLDFDNLPDTVFSEVGGVLVTTDADSVNVDVDRDRRADVVVPKTP